MSSLIGTSTTPDRPHAIVLPFKSTSTSLLTIEVLISEALLSDSPTELPVRHVNSFSADDAQRVGEGHNQLVGRVTAAPFCSWVICALSFEIRVVLGIRLRWDAGKRVTY